jgi:glutamine---fructose-6-phosphate transaminase (isomerizing)
MCGIVGYIGDKDIISILLVGLERLSYRGYDSSGISIISEGELDFWKKAGKIHELSKVFESLSVKGELGIGHTRWSTHGISNEVNAHPHVTRNKEFALVHNGIIENFELLKKKLIKKGYIFASETDTEVVLHLIEDNYDGDLSKAVMKAISYLEGTFSLAIITEKEPDKIIVARRGSPLLIGVSKSGNFVSSDINSIIHHTKDIVYMDDNEIAIIKKDGFSVFDLNGTAIHKEIKHISWDPNDADKGGYDHYMFKEIFEQPSVVRRIISKYIKDKVISFNHLRGLDFSQVSRFIIQACGTSWHAGVYGRYLIERFAKTLTEVDISSEFRYRHLLSQGNDIVMAISQSGETADTLACIREAKNKFFKVLSFVNVKESSIDRESDGVIYSHSGQEVGVASTKNYISQLVCMYLFTIYLADLKGTISVEEKELMIDELYKIPDYIQRILDQEDLIKAIASKYYLSREFLFIGRGVNYQSALEGALKLKEISYIHATGYAAGELKHGPIALIDSKLPVVCISPKSDTYQKMVSNIQEVKSRKGKTIILAPEGDEDIKKYADDIIYIPEVPEILSPILVAIPLQLLSYHIAINLDCDVDQPRNLAKSVTVE